jgi:hypothetical protein
MPYYNIPEGSEPKGSVTRPVRADCLERQAFFKFRREQSFLPVLKNWVSALSK